MSKTNHALATVGLVLAAFMLFVGTLGEQPARMIGGDVVDVEPSSFGLFGPPEFDWLPRLGSLAGMVREALAITWRHGAFVGFVASSIIHLTLAMMGGRNRCDCR